MKTGGSMQFYVAIIFLLISAFGMFILNRKRNGKKDVVWLARLHGTAGIIGLLILFSGLVRGYWGDWVWLALGLFSIFTIFSFVLFEKYFRKTKAPIFILVAHGLAAVFCVGVLTYSLILTN